MTGKDILDLEMGDNDADASTIREYLKRLLEAIWEEGERFSGKRPFGNSGWEYDLYKPLVRAGLIADAKYDHEYGDIEIDRLGQQEAEKLIFSAIQALN